MDATVINRDIYTTRLNKLYQAQSTEAKRDAKHNLTKFIRTLSPEELINLLHSEGLTYWAQSELETAIDQGIAVNTYTDLVPSYEAAKGFSTLFDSLAMTNPNLNFTEFLNTCVKKLLGTKTKRNH